VSPSAMTHPQVVEGIRAAIATYCQALDDGRTDDVVATFCPDGVMEIPGSSPLEGQDAIRESYSRFKWQRPQRHVVVNTLVTDWNDHEAKAISDLIVLQKGESGWAVQLVGRYHDTFQNKDNSWRFHRRTLSFVN